MNFKEWAQGLFDRAAPALLKQNEKSVEAPNSYGSTNCLYRGPRGLKCAIGHLVPDEVCTSNFPITCMPEMLEHLMKGLVVPSVSLPTTRSSGLSASVSAVDPALAFVNKEILPVNNFLWDLQRVHDAHPPEKWPSQFRLLASKYELNPGCLESSIPA